MLVELTNNLIEKGATSGIGYNWDQFKLLGIKTPPVHGWKNSIIGKFIHSETYSMFLKLKGLKPKERKVYDDEIERVCRMEFEE